MESEHENKVNWQLRLFLFLLVGLGIFVALAVIAISSDPFYAQSLAQSDQVASGIVEESIFQPVSALPTEDNLSSTMNLLFFSETWDSYSTRMEEVLAGLDGEFPIIKIDISENRQIASDYAVESPSTLLLVDSNGTEISRVIQASRADIDSMLLEVE